MPFKRLLAKSARGERQAQTLRKHTSAVMWSAAALVEATGKAQLTALGLDLAHWLEPFRRAVLVSALLHDLGKANDHFQGMICGERDWNKPQGLRHEAVSYLIARLPEIQDWIAPALEGTCKPDLVLWAVAGHHRKFPPDASPAGSGSVMNIFLRHPDFHKTLELGCDGHGLALGPPPKFKPDHELNYLSLTGAVVRNKLRRAGMEAEGTTKRMSPEERRFLAAVKACLICADVAGSIGRRGKETMADWIPEAFGRVPSAEQIKGIVAGRLRGKKPHDFQNEVRDASGNLALVVAGCGTGKTVAAYARAAEQHPDRRIFFCYPTTGTATEGYRDYLADPALEADLIHGRADVDKKLLLGTVPTDAEPPELGDDEPDHGEKRPEKSRRRAAAEDSAGAMEQWSTPLVGCTVDTVLGLLQNNRRGIYAWPSIAGSFCVFDEIHAYDEKLFSALLRFLKELPGAPALLMTASLPDARLRRLQEIMRERGESTEPIQGPRELEELPRYQGDSGGSEKEAWELVGETQKRGGKVLWVVNTVDAAIKLAESEKAAKFNPMVYHSRFRYDDRVKRHGSVIDAFKTDGFALAIATQVAEMSLDLSADLLITEVAPIASMIQRLGRLYRKPHEHKLANHGRFLVLEPKSHLPYKQEELDAARQWLDKLGDGLISQRGLVDAWRALEPDAPAPLRIPDGQLWLDGGFETWPGQLRESGPGIDVILKCDEDNVKDRRVRPEEVRVPMPPPRKGLHWEKWPIVGFCPVAPDGVIDYCAERGARWRD